MTQQLRVTRKVDFTGATKIGFGGLGQLSGDMFFVNGNSGADGYGVQSRNWKYPMKTIAATLDLCTANNNDYIIVLDHYQETFPISVDVASVHIIAAGPYNFSQPMVWLTASSDTSIFDIAADYVEIAGFEFKAGATHGAIEWTASKGYGLIRNCVFGRMQTGQDGINVPAGIADATEMVIEDCIFGPNLTRDGIRIDHNMTRGIIQNNLFLAVPGIGINITSQMAAGVIRNNRFMLPSDTAGKAITLTTACAGIYVSDNRANFGDTDSMGTIPWVDGGTGDANTWDNNLTSGAVDYPA